MAGTSYTIRRARDGHYFAGFNPLAPHGMMWSPLPRHAYPFDARRPVVPQIREISARVAARRLRYLNESPA